MVVFSVCLCGIGQLSAQVTKLYIGFSQDMTDDYQCNCALGWTGRNCDTGETSQSLYWRSRGPTTMG